MKLPAGNRIVLRRLVFSYFLLVIIVTSIVGSVSYTYFSSAFNEEIEHTNSILLNHYKMMIDNVLNKAERLSITLSVKSLNSGNLDFFFDKPVKGNNSKIMDIYKYLLNTISNNYEIVDSIEIYYKDCGMIISSLTGVTFLEPESEQARVYDDLTKRFNTTGKNVIWVGEAEPLNHAIGGNRYRYTLIRAYPNKISDRNTKGLFIINIKQDALNRIIEGSSVEHGGLMILNESGGIVCSNMENTQEYLESGLVKDVMRTTNNPVNEIRDINGRKVMVSYLTISNEWQLVYTMPIHLFYNKTMIIKRTIAVICFVTIIIGLVISKFFTTRIYDPIKALVKKIFESDKKYSLYHKDEYKIIASAFDELSTKVEKIQKTIEINKPLIRHNLVSALLKGQINSPDEFNALLSLAGCTMAHKNFRVLLIHIDSDTLKDKDINNKEYIRYSILQFVDSLSDDDNTFVSAFLSQCELAVIANTQNDYTYFENLAKVIVRCFDVNMKLNARICIGKTVSSPMELKQSYLDAVTLLREAFFLVRRRVFAEELLIKDRENQLPDDIKQAFSTGLKNQDIAKLEASVTGYVETVQSGKYTYEASWEMMLQLTGELKKYIKSNEYPIEGLMEDDVQDIVSSMTDVLQFQRWILETVKKVVSFVQEFEMNKNVLIIKEAQNYILDHLNTSFSLSDVAEHIGWSPHHFSKMFKQVTGQSFVDYVTQERIKKAKEILLQRKDLTVVEIAEEVGFNSSAYFINKFKSICKMTPNNYRLTHRVLDLANK